MGEHRLAMLRAAGAGDERAYEVLWRSANPAVVRYQRIMVGPRADEAALATWVATVRAIRSITDESRWRTELFGAAHLVATYWARPSAYPGIVDDIVLLPRDAPEAGEAASAIRVLHALPRRQREVLALYAVGRLTFGEIAAVLGRPERVVRRIAGSGMVALADDRRAAPTHTLDDIVRALRSRPMRSELIGWEQAVAVFRAEFPQSTVVALTPRTVASRPGAQRASTVASRPRHTGRLAATIIVCGLGTSGGAMLAAYAGVLPAPLQRIAHHIFDAPAPTSGTDRDDETGPPSGPAGSVSSAVRTEPAGRTGSGTTGHASHVPSHVPSHSRSGAPASGSGGPSGTHAPPGQNKSSTPRPAKSSGRTKSGSLSPSSREAPASGTGGAASTSSSTQSGGSAHG